jgi:hypothetical protein
MVRVIFFAAFHCQNAFNVTYFNKRRALLVAIHVQVVSDCAEILTSSGAKIAHNIQAAFLQVLIEIQPLGSHHFHFRRGWSPGTFT